MAGVRGLGPVLLWRATLAAALVAGTGLLPWLSRTDPALTVLKARSAERAPTPEVLAAIRAELGLDQGPLPLLSQWFQGLLRGDAGRSWISGAEVMPSVLPSLGVSLLLMAGALAVAFLTAGAVCARTLRHGTRTGSGGGSAMVASLPEFLTASVLVTVVGVQLGWLPALGWYGPAWMVLPALSLGLPAGALLGRMLDDALPSAFAEPWTRAAAARGLTRRRIARMALRRGIPGLLPNIGLFTVGLTGGAVAVEQIFDIPGLGRTTLQAALAQDLPVLQTGTLALVLLAATAGTVAKAGSRLLIGPALRDNALPTAHGPRRPAPSSLPYLYGGILAAVIALGLPRDPLTLDTTARLQPPSWAHPLGTDALGRDLLARIAHGALDTLALALAVTAAALLTGVLLGLFPRLSGPLTDTVNAIPAVLAGLLVTATAGTGAWTPVLAVAAVAWAPLAAHTAALLTQERATTHLLATRSLGATRIQLLRHDLLPAILPPVTRHALLRLPGVALALSSLSFLGLGAQPPAPEWGLLLAENQPYAERAPWAVLAPAAALALLGAFAVTTAGGIRRPRRPPRTPATMAEKPPTNGRGRAGTSPPAAAGVREEPPQGPADPPDRGPTGTGAVPARTRTAGAPTTKVTPRAPLTPLLRLLILTQLTFNLGFFAVMPFLAEHLGTAVGLAGWLVGFVLGLRTFSQQGLFVIGGLLADRYGVRPVVLAGCALRIAGFGWLGYATRPWAVIAAVLLIGFAGALFSPAVESEVARQAVLQEESGGGPRTRVLALFAVAGQAGAFVGPLLGALLLAVDFRAVCVTGAAVFVLVLLGHLRLLPQHIPGRPRTTARGGLRPLLRNRRFLALCCAYGSYLLAYNQLYLALPQEVQRATGSQSALAWLFALSSLLVVTAQLPVTRWAANRLDLHRSMTAGLLLVAAGFAAVAVARPAAWTGTAALGPAALLVVLLTLGQMLIVPTARAWVPDLADPARLGLYTGALSSVSGLIVLIGSSLTGSLLDTGLPPAVPWLILAALPAAAVALLPRHR